MTSRTKGKVGEREAAALIREHTGWEVTRRVRQHDGDSDLIGIPGWTVEVKRHRSAGRGEIAAWWRQTVEQAASDIPLLMYRLDRQDWRAVWPVAPLLQIQHADMWRGVEWTCDTSVQAWAAVAREVNFAKGLEAF
jgi:hypothetical protein